MTWPISYVNSTPEYAAVTVNNNTVNVTIASTAATWVVDVFSLGDSVGDAGLVFFLAQQAAVATEVQCFIGNVPQDPTAFIVGAARDRITLVGEALPADLQLVVRYLALLPADSTWVNEVLRIQDSTGLAGLAFTLQNEPLIPAATYVHVIKDGVLLVDTTDYTVSGSTLTLAVALAAGEQLIVTYAH